MSYWEIGDDRLRALLVPVRPEGDELDGEEGTPDGERPLDDLIARVVWSVLIEPGDKGAGRLIAAIGSVAAARLVLDGAPASALVDATAGGFDEESATEALDRWRPRRRWEDILRCLEGAIRCGASLVVPTDADWPPSLALLDESVPVLLWARGDRSLLRRPGIAIVGARAATGYGEHVAMELSAALSARDAVIVSGGAYGIDGMAHRAALASGGATVAVLAGGIDRLYPSGHEALLTRIAEQGLLVSEAPCGSAPTKWRFLQGSAQNMRLLRTVKSADDLRHPVGMDELLATDPDCPSCGTRCRQKGAAWWCYFCSVAVILVQEPASVRVKQ